MFIDYRMLYDQSRFAVEASTIFSSG